MPNLKLEIFTMNPRSLSFRTVDDGLIPLLKQYWLHYFGNEDPSSIEYYFQYQFSKEKSYVLMLGEELIGSLTVEPYAMSLHGKVLQTSLIVGVFVVEHHRKKGYMSYMMDTITKYLEDREILTCIQEQESGLYDRYGFEDVYIQNVWEVKRYMVEPMSSEGIRYVLDPQDCLELYDHFTRYFTGYFKRDLKYYEDLRREVHLSKKQMISYYRNQQLMATGLVVFDKEVGYVSELLYRDSHSMLVVLNYFLSMVPTLKVHTSKVEDLSLVIDDATAKDQVWMKVRLNDKDSFNRLYKVNILSARSAMNAFGKPVFNTQES